jgi:hypothetical protein
MKGDLSYVTLATDGLDAIIKSDKSTPGRQ